MKNHHSFFATCPKNLEGLLENELKALGAENSKQTVAGVNFTGDITLAYRVCLWSRIANRVLLPLTKAPVKNAETLYHAVQKIDWLAHMEPNSTFLVDFAGTSAALKNTQFCAQKVKDAIVDQIRDKTGIRPTIDKEKPQIRVNGYLQHDVVTISFDLSGESLHRRGYRGSVGKAPIKENLAAAILARTNWLELAQQGKPLLDPMCGTGTILIEAAMLAADFAPGLLRKTFGFTYWKQHQKELWDKLWQEAKERRQQGIENLSAEIRGYDANPRAIGSAQVNIERAGLDDCIAVIVKELSKFTPPTHHGKQVGIIVTNPPYGERLGEVDELVTLYRDFGAILRKNFLGWEVAMLTANPDFGKHMGIRAYKQYSFFNGAIPCKLLLFKIEESWFVSNSR